MSFLNRMMASVGIGSARVDTQLENAQVRAGEDLRGVVVVRGGGLEQQVEQINLYLMTSYLREVNDRMVRENITIGKFTVSGAFTIGNGEEKRFPFTVTLPAETPASAGSSRVWLRTGADIPMAVDPTDNDYIDVLPHKHTAPVLEAMERLGFRLRKVDSEYTRRLGKRFPFVQEFEYVPGGGQYRGRLDEVELVFFPSDNGVEVYIEVDRRARGFAGFLEAAFDADESRLWIQFDRQHLAAGVGYVAEQLGATLTRRSR